MNHAVCELVGKDYINEEVFRLDFVWPAKTVPRAGQFFMVRPRRGGFFLGRPISLAAWESDTVSFLIARRGGGTRELADMRIGEGAELLGPLGNAWTDFLPAIESTGGRSLALVGGGIGLAPLLALLRESPGHGFDLYAGFRTGPANIDERNALLGTAYDKADKVIEASQDGGFGQRGLIPDFLEPEKYAAVCACGPEPMLKVVAEKCSAVGVPCFVSLERRMACGVGACLGCTVRTVNGNRRCCADGPIFDAREIIFDG